MGKFPELRIAYFSTVKAFAHVREPWRQMDKEGTTLEASVVLSFITGSEKTSVTRFMGVVV